MSGHGFKPDVIEDDHYVFGGRKVFPVILQENGQWDDYLPVKEYQRKGLETMSCVSYGTLNCIEILHKRKYGEEVNFSDRYTAIVSDTTQEGNSPHKVAEAVRKLGLIDEKELPFTELMTNWDEYHFPKPMEKEYLDLGKKWLYEYSFKHEWVM